MVCTNCGAHLMETDQFCPKCGTKAIREKRCPDCGAVLREGTKFCHNCGCAVNGSGSAHKVADETIDIPIESIEENILSETAAEIRNDNRSQRAPRRVSEEDGKSSKPSSRTASGRSTAVRGESARGTSERSLAARGSVQRSGTSESVSGRSASPKGEPSRSESAKGTAPKKKAAEPETRRKSPAPPPQKKRAAYREEDWEDDNWEDDDDWDEDDWDDDEEESVDVITVMTAVIGCVLLVVVAVLGFNLYKQHVPKNYEQAAEKEQEQEDEGQGEGQDQDEGQEQGQDQEQGDVQVIEADGGGETYQLTVIHNVNVRDNPSTSGTNVLMVAQEGETYTCRGSAGDGDWYEIVLEDGSIGYVFQDYVTVE